MGLACAFGAVDEDAFPKGVAIRLLRFVLDGAPAFIDGGGVGRIHAGCLEQAFAGGVLVVIDQGDVPGQLVGGPPDQGQEGYGNPDEAEELHDPHAGGGGESEGVDSGVAGAILNGDAADEDGADHEPEHDPAKAGADAVVEAFPDEGFQQEEDQAAHHGHDQQRRDQDGDVVGEGLSGFALGGDHGVALFYVSDAGDASCRGGARVFDPQRLGKSSGAGMPARAAGG